jgi:hypothetical protein
VIFHLPKTHASAISTEIRGRIYTVQPGENVEIPEEVVYVIERRGLPLVQGKIAGADVVASEKAPAPPPRPLPPGIEVGKIRQAAREADEDEDGDGPALEGDDDELESDEDPIKKTIAQLEKDGVETSLLGKKKKR